MSFGRLFVDGKIPTDVSQKNKRNAKIHGQVRGVETRQIFEAGYQALLQVPFDSVDADIIIAGMSIWAMIQQDFSDNQMHPFYYPQLTISELYDICFTGEKSKNHHRESMIKRIGYFALVEKKLEFEGTLSMFYDSRWIDRDWSELTDRFNKYDLPPSSTRQQVITFLNKSESLKLLNTLQPKMSKKNQEWLWRIGNTLSLPELFDCADMMLTEHQKYLAKPTSCCPSFVGRFFVTTENGVYIPKLLENLLEDIETTRKTSKKLK